MTGFYGVLARTTNLKVFANIEYWITSVKYSKKNESWKLAFRTQGRTS